MRHFDVDGVAPPLDSKETFLVRETESRVLRPGRSTSLTPYRDNIHTFEAGPDGALGFDVNTFLPGEGDWSQLELDDEAPRGRDRLFEARWIGKPGAESLSSRRGEAARLRRPRPRRTNLIRFSPPRS